MFRNLVITGLCAASALIAYFVWDYEGNVDTSKHAPQEYSVGLSSRLPKYSSIEPSQEHNQITPKRELPLTDPSRLRQQKLDYFNSQYQRVIALTRQGKYEEADELSLKLEREIQKERGR